MLINVGLWCLMVVFMVVMVQIFVVVLMVVFGGG